MFKLKDPTCLHGRFEWKTWNPEVVFCFSSSIKLACIIVSYLYLLEEKDRFEEVKAGSFL